MRFLITGARGQVGTALTQRLSLLGIDNIALSRRDLDLTSPRQIREVLTHCRPQAVINCAAYNEVDKGETEPALAYAINGTGPAYLADVCAEIGSVLVHFSTDYVFDGEKSQPYPEDAQTNPLSTYGMSKLAGEQAVLQSTAAHLVLRVSWIFGRIGKSFVDDILRWVSSGTLRIVADQRSVPCDAVSLAAATVEATQKLIEDPRLSGLYHFAMGSPVTRYQYAKDIVQQATRFGIIAPVPVVAVSSDYFSSAAKRPANSALDGSKFEQRFGIDSGNWQVGLETYLDYLTKSPSTISTPRREQM